METYGDIDVNTFVLGHQRGSQPGSSGCMPKPDGGLVALEPAAGKFTMFAGEGARVLDRTAVTDPGR
jgi:hypothetical protein